MVCAIIASIDSVLNRFASFVLVFVTGITRDHAGWSKFADVERAPSIVFGSGGAKRLDRNLAPIYGKDVFTARRFTKSIVANHPWVTAKHSSDGLSTRGRISLEG